jgi:hypothetical protein
VSDGRVVAIGPRCAALLADARASAARWKSGQPLSSLDGVPITVKDEFDVVGHATKVGTSLLQAAASSSASFSEERRFDARCADASARELQMAAIWPTSPLRVRRVR